MASRARKAVAQVAMISVIVIYYITFMLVGLSSVIVDRSLPQDNCGKSTHLWKYSVLNTAFAGIILVTYMSFPGGGEGARARALMISILHFGLCVWGFLVRASLPECIDVIRSHYSQIYFFYGICLWHNLVFVILYALHELFLGEWLGGDLTLIPEVRKYDTVDFSYQQDHHQTFVPGQVEPTSMLTPQSAPPSATMVAPSATQDVQPLLKGSISGTTLEVVQEYAILQSPESSTLNIDPRLPSTPQRGL
jgi:hypothetical protein